MKFSKTFFFQNIFDEGPNFTIGNKYYHLSLKYLAHLVDFFGENFATN